MTSFPRYVQPKPADTGLGGVGPQPKQPSAYQMGQAQPKQQPSQGTPYGSLMATRQPAPQPAQQPAQGGAYSAWSPQPSGQGQRLSPMFTLYPPGVYPSSPPPAQQPRQPSPHGQPMGDALPMAGADGKRSFEGGDYGGWKRQQATQQAQANYDELMRYRQMYPGMSDAALQGAMAQDKAQREQESQDAYTEKYGSPSEKADLKKRQQQRRDWEAQQAADEQFRGPHWGMVDQNEQRPWKYDPSQPGGVKYLDNPGGLRATAPQYSPGQGQGNLAYATPDQRPAPFTQSSSFMGQPVDPGQFYGQRDAFINNINQARQSFAQNPTPQGQQLDFPGLWSQAGNMVQQGWQNPLAGLMR